MKGVRERCLDAGMDGYLSKPFRQIELLEAIHAVCDNTFSSVKLSEPDPTSAHFDVDAEKEDKEQEEIEGIVNWSVALDAALGDESILKRLAETSIRETVELVGPLCKAVNEGDLATVQRSAHTLKNHYRIYDVAVADHVAFHIENTARDGSLELDLEPKKLADENERLQSELAAYLEGRIDLQRRNDDNA
jgi:CheY-like chemotaxis protein